MTDIALARAELIELQKHVQLALGYVETIEVAVAGLKAELAAIDIRAGNALAALEDDQPPDSLPKASLHDAADTPPGGVMVFRVTLDKPSEDDVAVTVIVNGKSTTQSIAAGQTSLIIEVPIAEDAAPATVTAKISEAEGLEIADGEAVGRIVAAVPPGDPVLFSADVPLTEPYLFDEGELLGARTWLAKVIFPRATPTGYAKVFGAEFSGEPQRAGMVLGRRPNGDVEAVVTAEGSQYVQVTSPVEALKPVLIGWRLRDLGNNNHALDLIADRVVSTKVFIGAPAEFDGRAVAAAGYWNGVVVDPQRLEAALISLDVMTDEQIAAWDEAHPVVTPPGNGGGNGNGNGGGNGGGGGNEPRPVEPVNPGLHQVTLAIASDAPTHVWEGAGTGLNAFADARSVFSRVVPHKARLDRIGMHVLRIFTPNGRADCVAAYKPYFDLFRPRLVVASGFVYRSGGPVRANIRALAEGVKYCWDQGLPIHIVTLQNEPDGNPGNKPRDGTYADHQRALRDDLNSLGLQRVKIAALEWRHPPNGGIPEFDQLKTAGLIGKGKAVELGCGHVYDKTQGLDLADRLRSVGSTWSSWETGNNGSGCSSVARALSAANLGSAFDCLHYVMVTTATPNNEQLGQAFLDYGGRDRPWAGHWEVAFGKALLPESTVYRCSSSDRAPGMPTTMDQWMVRNAAVSGGRNPRLNVVVAKRKDGKTAIVATNTTHDSDAFSPYTAGHYGNLNQQHTLRVPWLAGKDGSFQVWRAAPEGGVSGPQVVGMDDGLVRWSVSGAQTVGLVGGAA